MDPPVNQVRRSWTDNNVQYTMQTTTYSRPGVSFSFNGGTARRGFSQPQSPVRAQSTGILGTAFNILGDVLATKQQRAVEERLRRNESQVNSHSPVGGQQRSRQSRSLFSELTETILNAQANPQQYSRQSTQQRSSNRPAASGRSRSYRTSDRRSSRSDARSAYVEDYSDDEDSGDIFEERAAPRQPNPRRAFTANDAANIVTLQNELEEYQRLAQQCRAKIQAISGNRNVNVEVLQTLINELKRHETAFQRTQRELQNARAGLDGHAAGGSMPRQQSSSQHRASRTQNQEFGGRSEFNAFNFQGPPDPFFSQFFASEPDPFDDFDDPFFASFSSSRPFVFTMPSARFTFTGGQNERKTSSGPTPQPQFQRTPGFSTTPRAPPANLLKPEEAKRLFKAYNDKWNALTPTDPNIPYPARGLKAGALVARDSLWAPAISSSVDTWSEEVVMQANVQAFFLGVVGLLPNYSEAPATRRVVMGYNKAQTSAAQAKELVDILKKEKGRWHSDRLGRRNGGRSCPNEALQCDERARSVFHGVCELMEFAQGA